MWSTMQSTAYSCAGSSLFLVLRITFLSYLSVGLSLFSSILITTSYMLSLCVPSHCVHSRCFCLRCMLRVTCYHVVFIRISFRLIACCRIAFSCAAFFCSFSVLHSLVFPHDADLLSITVCFVVYVECTVSHIPSVGHPPSILFLILSNRPCTVAGLDSNGTQLIHTVFDISSSWKLKLLYLATFRRIFEWTHFSR